MRFLRKLVLCAALLLPCAALAATPSDRLLASLRPRGFVSDFAGVFSGAERADLERFLGDLQRRTSAEVAVVAIRSMEGGDIDDFANRLFEQWGIGKKGTDNGVLLLASIEDRKVRIEVGYGLEGALPDAVTGRILDTEVIPRFKAGAYGQGLTAGAAGVARRIATEAGITLQGEPVVARTRPGTRRGRGKPGVMHVIMLIVMVVLFIRNPSLFFLLLMSGSMGGSSRGGFGGGGGGGFGGFGGGMSGGGGASRGW